MFPDSKRAVGFLARSLGSLRSHKTPSSHDGGVCGVRHVHVRPLGGGRLQVLICAGETAEISHFRLYLCNLTTVPVLPAGPWRPDSGQWFV